MKEPGNEVVEGLHFIWHHATSRENILSRLANSFIYSGSGHSLVTCELRAARGTANIYVPTSNLQESLFAFKLFSFHWLPHELYVVLTS